MEAKKEESDRCGVPSANYPGMDPLTFDGESRWSPTLQLANDWIPWNPVLDTIRCCDGTGQGRGEIAGLPGS